MAIFNSYVKLPEGIWLPGSTAQVVRQRLLEIRVQTKGLKAR